MVPDADRDSGLPPPAYYRQVRQRFVQAALIRAGASIIMWLFALGAYLLDIIAPHHIKGVSLAVLYLIAINPPSLWMLKGLRSRRGLARFAFLINLLEIVGYTAIIYALGGIEATYLTIIYAALIAYVGAMTDPRQTFLIAGACLVSYTIMVLLEGAGTIPWLKVIPDFHLTWPHRLARMSVVAGLLLVIAFIASHTATLRRRTRNALRNSQRDLELRVAERTADLTRANEELQAEIQERIAAERSLKEAHETFLTVLDSIDATIYTADFESHEILFMNRQMKDTFGQDFTGSRCWEVFRGEGAPCPHCTMEHLLDEDGEPTGVHIWEDENPVTERWYINHDRAIKWIDGRWVFLQIAVDITQLKRLERERLDTQDKLHRAQKMEALGMLAGGVAHDLNNILSGVVSFPELVLMDLPSDSPMREPIEVIRNSGQKAAAIVQDLLNLARRGLPVTEILDLNAVVADYLKSPEHQNLLRQYPACRLEADCAQGLMAMAGKPSQLSKVVMNLVSNAFEAMPEGGCARLATANQYIDRTHSGFEDLDEGEYVVLTVADEGVGIAPEDRERIFEPFFTKKVLGHSGTGLGMAVVWGVVKDLEGIIDVQSDPGAGTTFRLFFPVSRQVASQDAAQAHREALKGQGQSVLVVDDVADQRRIACLILRKLNYDPAAVESGEEALAYLQDHSVDLLLIDMIMDPGMDGLETFQAVRKIRPDQKAIIASGFAETERVTAALQLGAEAYLRKPYTIEQIGREMQKALGKAASGSDDR